MLRHDERAHFVHKTIYLKIPTVTKVDQKVILMRIWWLPTLWN